MDRVSLPIPTQLGAPCLCFFKTSSRGDLVTGISTTFSVISQEKDFGLGLKTEEPGVTAPAPGRL